MAPFYLMVALLIQSSLCYADVLKNETESIELVAEVVDTKNSSKDTENIVESIINIEEDFIAVEEENAILKSDIEEILINDFRTATNDWVDMFLGPSSESMVQATSSNKSPEEQLEEIKEVASEITMAIQSEMANLLSYALNYVDKDMEDNKFRKKRSIETPMDSSQLVMKLLNHIKCNNQYQIIAIEKMMSAQEIADKYGVEFSPDPEILSDLAFAANEQAKELTSILQDACNANNSSCAVGGVEAIAPVLNTTYHLLSSEYPDRENISTSQDHEHAFQPTWDTSHIHYSDNHGGYNYYSYPYETQIASPPVQYNYGPSVTPKPTFYDSISYNPNDYYSPYCSVDPMAYLPVYSYDEPLDLEPELVGEEYEEIVSSKLIIEQDDEPGSATVNHVTTYTVSEKAHFRSPQIEKLPQQMQYYFYLM